MYVCMDVVRVDKDNNAGTVDTTMAFITPSVLMPGQPLPLSLCFTSPTLFLSCHLGSIIFISYNFFSSSE